MVDLPMSPPTTKDRSILAVTEGGRVTFDTFKLKAIILALLTAFGGWKLRDTAVDIKQQETDEFMAHVKAENERLGQIEAKIDLLIKLANR